MKKWQKKLIEAGEKLDLKVAFARLKGNKK